MKQTLAPYEVILLDDASTDNSQEVIRSLLDTYPDIRYLPNSANSGNTFKQWEKGMREVREEYIWIAESDDFADPEFLSILVGQLERSPKASIAFCRSVLVDQGGMELVKFWGGDDWDWEKSCYRKGTEAVRGPFVSRNLIPNASSAVIRRSACLQAQPLDTSFVLCGDWKYYMQLLRVGDLLYEAQPLSYWRQHEHTVREKSALGRLVALEAYQILDWMRKNEKPDSQELKRAYHQFAYILYQDLIECPRELRPKLLRATWDALEQDPILPLRLVRFALGSARRKLSGTGDPAMA